MGKYLSLEEMKKKAGVSEGKTTTKNQSGYSSLEEIKSRDTSKFGTGSVGKTITASNSKQPVAQPPVVFVL